MKKIDNILETVKSGFRKNTFAIRKSAPQIMIVVGIAGMVVGTVAACRATSKLDDILDERDDALDEIEDEVAEEDQKKEVLKVNAKAALDIVKIYAPAVGIDIVSVLLILKGKNLFVGRQAALASAYAALNTGYKNYRKRVVDELGEDADRRFQYGLSKHETKEKVTDEDGKTKTVKNVLDVVEDPNLYSVYARFFDEASPFWQKDALYNKTFVQIKQNEFNIRLQAEKFVFLNDVYEALGLPKSRAGQIVGWRYDEENPTGDNYIDFGIFDVHKSTSRDFINGYERSILLDFNVDGPIIDYIDDYAA